MWEGRPPLPVWQAPLLSRHLTRKGHRREPAITCLTSVWPQVRYHACFSPVLGAVRHRAGHLAATHPASPGTALRRPTKPFHGLSARVVRQYRHHHLCLACRRQGPCMPRLGTGGRSTDAASHPPQRCCHCVVRTGELIRTRCSDALASYGCTNWSTTGRSSPSMAFTQEAAHQDVILRGGKDPE